MKINNQTLEIFQRSEELFSAAAIDFAKRTTDIIEKKGNCRIVLSGGNTPKKFYSAITSNESLKKEIPWDKLYFFFGDERFVPPDSAQSNFHTAQEYLFSIVPVPRENIFRIHTEYSSAEKAAKDYDNLIKKLIKDSSCSSLFDLCYLGMGADGHTASLMPFIKYDAARLADSFWVEPLAMFRITLTPLALNHSAQIIFLVEGADKAMALKEVIEIRQDPLRYPAILIDKALWYLDTTAANAISR